MLCSKLLIKMWETTTEKGIGALFKPWIIRREGEATIETKRKELLILAQTEVDIGKIKRGEASLLLNDISNPKLIHTTNSVDNDERVEPNFDIAKLVNDYNVLSSCEEIQKEVNITRALLHAEHALENDITDPSDDSIEDDWLYRWRDYARNTNSEKLQILWGNILAGEVKQPGAFSLRTLDFIKNLSQSEAREIEGLFNYVFWGYRILNSEINNESTHEFLNFDFLFKMQGLGLISGVDSGLSSTLTLDLIDQDYYYSYIFYNEMGIHIRTKTPESKVVLPVLLLTNLGKEVYKLCTPVSDRDNFINIVNTIKTLGFEVHECRLIDFNGRKSLGNFVAL